MLRKRDSFITNFSVKPLLFISVLAVLRLTLCFEFELTYEVEFFDGIYMDIINFLFMPSISLGFTEFEPCVAHLLLLVWIVGSMVLLADTCRDVRKGKQLLRETYIVEDEGISIFVKNHLPSLKAGREVRVLEADWVETPIITGLFNPTILLPLIDFTDEELKCILKHECQHFKNRDIWMKLYIRAIVILFWWNPFAHMLESNLNHILEIRCDLDITKDMSEREKLSYLDTILKIVKIQKKNTELRRKCCESARNPAMAFMVSVDKHSKLTQRFTLITNEVKGNENKKGQLAFCLAMLILFCVSYLFVFQAAGSAPTFEDGYEIFGVEFNETTCLVPNENGNYDLYNNGEFIFEVTKPHEEPFCEVEIKEHI